MSYSTDLATMNADLITEFGEAVTFWRTGETDQAVSVVWDDDEQPKAWAPEVNFTWPVRKGDGCIRGAGNFKVIDPPTGGATPERAGGASVNLYLKRVYGANA